MNRLRRRRCLKGTTSRSLTRLDLRSGLGRRLTYPELVSGHPGVARSYEPPGKIKPYAIEKGGLPVQAGNEDHHWSRVGQVPGILLAFAQRNFTQIPLLRGAGLPKGQAERKDQADSMLWRSQRRPQLNRNLESLRNQPEIDRVLRQFGSSSQP